MISVIDLTPTNDESHFKVEIIDHSYE